MASAARALFVFATHAVFERVAEGGRRTPPPLIEPAMLKAAFLDVETGSETVSG